MKPLVKDCQCVTHEGPHWLHMSRIDRRKNRELWEDANRRKDAYLLRWVAGAEARRLTELLRELRYAGYTESDPLPPEVREVVRFRPAPALARGAGCSSGADGSGAGSPVGSAAGAVTRE